VLDVSNIITADQSSLASNLAFVVVGGPLLAGVTIWLRNSLKDNPSEGHGFIPTFFATLAAIVSLLVFFSSTVAAIHNLINDDDVLGSTLGRVIIWGAAWVIVLRVSNSIIPKRDFRIQYFVGSFITALAALIGLVQVLTGVLSLIISQPIFLDTQQLALVSPNNPTRIGLGTLAVSGGLWFYYWIKNANTIKSDTLWLGYVLIAGVGGTLVVAITSLSISLYRVLVWFIGESIFKGYLYWSFRGSEIVSEKVDRFMQFLPLEAMTNVIKEPFSRLGVIRSAANTMGEAFTKSYEVEFSAILIVLFWTFIFIFSSYKIIEKRDL
jgi:hypothetical protein